jgi:hypothetical protein
MGHGVRAAALVLLAGVILVGIWAEIVSDAHGGITLVALIAGMAVGGATSWAILRRREISSGVGLIVAAVLVPTYFAYAINVLLLLFGVTLVLHGIEERRLGARA